jgi:Secretion system C-terminal sorting domain/Concanavalin A-like lectin/glucanases superfamily
MGFSTATCHSNIVITRGKTGPATGTYKMEFQDGPTDGDDCYTYDTTKDIFYSVATSSGSELVPDSAREFSYSPQIVENVWYTVVITFNDTSYKTYVNDTLKAVATITTPGTPIGTSTDSVSIGYDIFEAADGYPFPYKGIIDDIQLYNRVLSDSEISAYSAGDSAMTGGGTLTVKGNKIPQVEFYPNPAEKCLNVNASENISGVKITDILGKEVANTAPNSNSTTINIKELPTGLYLVNLYFTDHVITKKFVKD